MAQKKDTALSVAARREMSDLLAQSREASARIRVENIIHTDITVELMEILELYAELLLARSGLLDVRDKERKEGNLPGASAGGADGGVDQTGLEEAAASLIYAAPRLPREVRELGVVRGLLVDRFGKEFAQRAQENRDGIVPERVVKKLKVDPPGERLVTAYLEEIARTYGVEWPRRRVGEDEEMEGLGREVDGEDEDDDGGVGGGMKEAPLLADGSTATDAKKTEGDDSAATSKKKVDLGKAFDRAELDKATPPRAIQPGGAKSPVSVAPPGARSDNPRPSVRLPGGADAGGKKKDVGGTGATGAGSGSGANAVGGKVPTVDDLAKRFQALKR